MHYKDKAASIEKAFDANGVLVIADTPSQVNKALKAIDKYRGEEKPGAEFIFVVDEADAMYRTKDRGQKFEQEMEKVFAKRPIMVSWDLCG